MLNCIVIPCLLGAANWKEEGDFSHTNSRADLHVGGPQYYPGAKRMNKWDRLQSMDTGVRGMGHWEAFVKGWHKRDSVQ